MPTSPLDILRGVRTTRCLKTKLRIKGAYTLTRTNPYEKTSDFLTNGARIRRIRTFRYKSNGAVVTSQVGNRRAEYERVLIPELATHFYHSHFSSGQCCSHGDEGRELSQSQLGSQMSRLGRLGEAVGMPK